MGLDDLRHEINLIADSDIRTFTLKVVDKTPGDSWRMPSSRDHHLRDECGEWGNLIHTLRVVRICEWLTDILDLPQVQRDLLKAAAILHDSCKHGVDAEATWIYRDHPALVRLLVDRAGCSCRQRETILSIIESHMGRWGNPPEYWRDGRVSLRLLLHIADCVEARLSHILNTEEQRK
jgi:hypothetical protein